MPVLFTTFSLGLWCIIPILWTLLVLFMFGSVLFDDGPDLELMAFVFMLILVPVLFMIATHLLVGLLWLLAPAIWLIGVLIFLGWNGTIFGSPSDGDANGIQLILLYAGPPLTFMLLTRALS